MFCVTPCGIDKIVTKLCFGNYATKSIFFHRQIIDLDRIRASHEDDVYGFGRV